MADINSFNCTARLVEDPELRYTPAGKAVCNMRLAINGIKEEDTTWLGAVAWERTAETANEYLKKGSKVGLSGRLQTRSWETQDGQKRQVIELVVTNLALIDSKRDGQQSQQGGRQQQGGQQQRAGGQQQRAGQQQRPANQGQGNQNRRPSGWGSDNSGQDSLGDLGVDEIPFD